MKRNWSLWLGLGMLGIILFFTFIGPKLSFVDPAPAESRMRFYDDGSFSRAPFPPSKLDFFGTDRDGRDLLSLIILGLKDTLKFIVLITCIRYVIGIPLAFLASNKRGIAYWISSGWHSLFSSIPIVFSAILLLNLPILGGYLVANQTYTYWAILFLALIEVGRVSQIFTHELYGLSKQEYVKAGITLGNNPLQLYVNHYIPNLMPSLIVNFFSDLGRVTLLIGQLALFQYFIVKKLLIQEEGPVIVSGAFDWQSLLVNARYDIIPAVWIPFFPALAITFLIFTFYLLGEGLRQYYNLKTSTYSIPLMERIGSIIIDGINGVLSISRKVQGLNPIEVLKGVFYISKFLFKTVFIYFFSAFLLVLIVYLPVIDFVPNPSDQSKPPTLYIGWEQSKEEISIFLKRLVEEKQLGLTSSHRSVEGEIKRVFPRSAKILIISFFLVMVFGVLKGIFDFRNRNRWSKVIGDRFTSMVQSFPDFYFITAIIWVILFYFSYLDILLFAHGKWYGFVLPALVVSLYPISYVAKITMGALTEEFGKQYVQVSFAKGFNEKITVHRHMIQNCYATIFSHITSVMVLLLSNLFILELFLDYKGAALRLYTAIPYEKEVIISFAWIFMTIVFVTQIIASLLRYYIDPTLRRTS